MTQSKSTPIQTAPIQSQPVSKVKLAISPTIQGFGLLRSDEVYIADPENKHNGKFKSLSILPSGWISLVSQDGVTVYLPPQSVDFAL